jgi:hypothetical protein
MAKYEQSNFEQIASAIGVDVGQIAKHENLFEAAALWYRLARGQLIVPSKLREKLDPIADRGQPKRIAPSKLREKLDPIAKNARRLLKSLGVNDPDEAPDGPGSNREILAALVLVGERNEDPVIEATERIGRLAEIMDGIAAAAELEGRAKKAAIEVTKIGKLIVREGNPGDDAVNGWIAAMMDLYRRITGRKPATSVGAFKRPNEGIAEGPLIRFLQAAAKPLKMKGSSWNRVGDF